VAALVLLCDRALKLLAVHPDQIVPFAEKVVVVARVAGPERFEGKADLLSFAWHVDVNLQIGGVVQRGIEVAVLTKAVLALGA
jgi:hypothetical protein